MGYSTDFTGGFDIVKVREDAMDFDRLAGYVNRFADVRHMKRDNDVIKGFFRAWPLLGFEGDLGRDGEFFVGGLGFCGQDDDPSVVDHNRPGGSCPGLWCHWVVEGKKLTWDGGEKFYNYTEWLYYLMANFFGPAGYAIEGTVEYQGDDFGDRGTITVRNGEVVSQKTGPLTEASDAELIAECVRRGLFG